MFSVRCRCSCGCTIRRNFPRTMLTTICYPCAVGVHTPKLRTSGYPFGGRSSAPATITPGHDSAGMSPDVIAAPEGSQ